MFGNKVLLHALNLQCPPVPLETKSWVVQQLDESTRTVRRIKVPSHVKVAGMWEAYGIKSTVIKETMLAVAALPS